MAEIILTRQGFLRMSGALGGAVAAVGAFAGPAGAHVRREPAAAGSGGPLLADETFPIGVFWPPPPLQTTLERWQEMADAGFTYVHSNNYLYADHYIQRHALGIADQVGLKVLVDDGDVRWLTHQFTISDDGGAFTLTRAEAETKLREVIRKYAGDGFWQIVDGRLLFDGGTGNGSIGWTLDGAEWTDYTFEFDTAPRATGAGGYAQAGWAFRVQDEGNAYVWLLTNRPADGAPSALVKAVFVGGAPQVTTTLLPFAVVPDQTYRVATTLEGDTITTTIDGVVVDTTTDATFASGPVGFREAGSESAFFDDVVVTAPDGEVLFTEDFASDLGAWRRPGGGFASFAGLHVYDEPSVAKLPDLAIVLDIIRSIDPECLPYVNHLPGFDYVEAVEQTNPEVLSFDRYPILLEGEDAGYFRNWADVRAAALPGGIPTWAYIQSVGYTNHAVPTKDDLYWQVNISLAYGCKGIQYFTYWTPDPARGENFTGGIMTVEGERTPLYDHTREVNTRYLAAIGRQMLPLTSTAVQAANLDPVPDGLEPFAPDDDVEQVRGDAVVLGRFTGPDEQRYLLVANHSRHERANVGVRWGSAVGGVATYEPERERYRDRGDRDLSLRLGPGRATLVRIEPR
ncbi:hypothetical protein Bcav_1349 [Beutenbergia cavernae DSM 12333]|uniref:Glycoside hydrolase family 42 N-terminal domain-containing protein n=1 Tax=Beutenbergia cavernae (strain ATCC BAA-8 / DSM 12333 / CCUG 43141 / JCM 11478 / NBRC 16432 / NCIMB 13614 / HKI 0122) TaxID=471853 RepID=C5C1Z0_BEUC1|nr:hypothetical protein [Beutenbergia cavernae]ACQ79608.1 hypothetical protein Bcav_1349 [Beutenbergia cavernae DSM 12333]